MNNLQLDTNGSNSLLGDCPPFVDKAFWVNDSIEKKAYMVGYTRQQSHADIRLLLSRF